MERTVFELTLTDGTTLYLTAWYAPNPDPITDDGDASIGYRLAPADGPGEPVYGEMLYVSAQKTYDRIQDAKDDLVAHLSKNGSLKTAILLAEETNLDPDDYL